MYDNRVEISTLLTTILRLIELILVCRFGFNVLSGLSHPGTFFVHSQNVFLYGPKISIKTGNDQYTENI